MAAYKKNYGMSIKRPMRCGNGLALVILICALLASCGAPEQPKPSLESEDPNLVLWPRAEKALRLRFNADQDLNVYESRAHSIQVCVYQLDNPEAFLNLARTRDGITILLRAESFDKSVKSVVRLFVQPRESTVVELDRAENATFVAIVCGYFDSAPEDAAKVWEIKPAATTTGLLFWKSTSYSAGTLDLTLRLMARAMVESVGQEPQQGTPQ